MGDGRKGKYIAINLEFILQCCMHIYIDGDNDKHVQTFISIQCVNKTGTKCFMKHN